MKPKIKITVINAYGDLVPNAKARYHEKGSSGNPLRVEISAPGYVTHSFYRFLEAVDTGIYMLLMDPETAEGPDLPHACWRNLLEAMIHVRIRSQRLGFYLIGPSIEKQQDRCYFQVYQATELLRNLDRTGTMKRVPSKLHTPHEEGYECVGSWKTTRNAPVLQVTMWHHPVTGKYVGELDMDMKAGLGHVGEVVKNHITNGKTHPFLVSQAMAWSWGVVAFTLRPGE
jgi:hypothetical protein